MLHINLPSLLGVKFTGLDPNVQYNCIGYGQNPSDGSNYVVGEQFDSVNNRTHVKTFLIKDIKFLGTLTPISKTS